MTESLRKEKQAEENLILHYQKLLDTEITSYVKYLKVDEKLKFPKLYKRMIEKYPKFIVSPISENLRYGRKIEGRAIYKAALNHSKNRTSSKAWERW